VHTLLGLSSLLLIVFGSYLTLSLLDGLSQWSQRRNIQVFILSSPLASLGLSIGGLHHFFGRICLLPTPSWDYLLGVVLPLGMGLVALGALGLGVVRLALMRRLVARSGVSAGPELQALADRLAQRLGATRSQMLLSPYDRPLALTCGIFRPTVLLSTWMVEHLDPRELEAVITHELAHVVRRDYLVLWLATVLRDAFFYLPTSRAAYRQLQREKELACDDLAVGVTDRPLALASALAKVWLHALDGLQFNRYTIAQPLVGGNKSINDRIERLLNRPRPTKSMASSRKVVLGINALALLALVIVQVTNFTVVLASMGCNPLALFWKLF